MKKVIWFIAVALIIMFNSPNARAVPNLGIATDGPYYSTELDLTEYQNDWTTTILPIGPNQEEGFAIGSGDTLYLWVTDQGEDADGHIFYKDIYLLTDATTTNSESNPVPITDVTFGGNLLSGTFTNQVDGYKPKPYSGISLGPVLDEYDSLNTGWELLATVNPTADGYPGKTYVYTGIIQFNGALDGVDHFFTFADINENGEYNGGADMFSPKTTSGVGVPVPEPSTLLLLGSGLAALGVIGRKKW